MILKKIQLFTKFDKGFQIHARSVRHDNEGVKASACRRHTLGLHKIMYSEPSYSNEDLLFRGDALRLPITIKSSCRSAGVFSTFLKLKQIQRVYRRQSVQKRRSKVTTQFEYFVNRGCFEFLRLHLEIVRLSSHHIYSLDSV